MIKKMKHEKKHLCFFFTCTKCKSLENTKRCMVKQKTTRDAVNDTSIELVKISLKHDDELIGT